MLSRHQREAIESAETTAIRRPRVMELLRHIGCDTVLKRHTRRQKVAPVDGQQAISVVLAPEAERTFGNKISLFTSCSYLNTQHHPTPRTQQNESNP
jgi:hypothetical protein